MVSPTAIQNGTDLTRAPAGSGGWIWQPDQHQEGVKHVAVANPDYWNKDAVLVETIAFDIIADAGGRFNALLADQVDVMANLPLAQVNAATSADIKVKSFLSSSAVIAIFDRQGTIVPAFASEDVRNAMQLLVDRDGYNASINLGYGSPSASLGAEGTYWYDENLDDNYKYDVTKAKELLTEAGYPDGFSFDVPSIPSIQARLEAFQQMFAAGGITMNIIGSADGQYSADLRKGKYPAGLLLPNPIDPFTMWYRSISNESPYNPFNLTDTADLDAKMVEAAEISSDPERAIVIKQVQEQIIDRGLVVNAGVSPGAIGFGPKVHATKEPFMTNLDSAPRLHYIWLSDK